MNYFLGNKKYFVPVTSWGRGGATALQTRSSWKAEQLSCLALAPTLSPFRFPGMLTGWLDNVCIDLLFANTWGPFPLCTSQSTFL